MGGKYLDCGEDGQPFTGLLPCLWVKDSAHLRICVSDCLLMHICWSWRITSCVSCVWPVSTSLESDDPLGSSISHTWCCARCNNGIWQDQLLPQWVKTQPSTLWPLLPVKQILTCRNHFNLHRTLQTATFNRHHDQNHISFPCAGNARVP